MRGFLSKKNGLIATVVVAVVAVVLVAIFALGGGKEPQGDAQLAADAGLQAVRSTEGSKEEGRETVMSEGSSQEKASEESSEENEAAEPSRGSVKANEETEAAKPSKEVVAAKAELESSVAPEVPSSAPANHDDTGNAPTQPAIPEEENYYRENGEVVRIIDANASEDVPTEEEVMTLLSERGFADFPVTFDYGMDGAYVGQEEIAGDAATKHPMYQTNFITENQELWTIFVINGSVVANPVSYNLESSREAQLLISESQEITSYNSHTNKYYVTIPKESAVIVRTVDKIDVETLNQLTCEEIDGL